MKMNKEVVDMALKAALTLNCKINKKMHFDRKNYFYPDLPKGFQITQMHDPVGVDGNITIECDDYEKNVLIHDIHLEEDAASLDHYYDTSLIDYNRAGVPLLELVTEPCLSSAEEAVAFLETMRRIYQYCGVSEADTKKGQIRCDVNVSIMDPDATELGTKVEIKNINSFGNVYDAIIYEVKRQSELKDAGRYDEVVQETRRFDDAKGIGYAMRTKEDANDYRYFPEPDLAPIVLSDEYIENIKNNLPELPHIRKERYVKEYKIPEYDAQILTSSKNTANFFEEATKICNNPKAVSNWIMVDFTKKLNDDEIEIQNSKVTPENLAHLVELIDKGTISSKIAKKVFDEMYETGKDAKKIVEDNGMTQMSDEGAIKEIVEKIVAANPKSVEDYKAGKDRAIGFLVGQVMKETHGKANPGIVNKFLLEILNK